MPVKLDSLVEKAKKLGADQAEIIFTRSSSTSIEVLNQEIESCDTLETAGIGIRIIQDQRLGFSYTSNLEEIEAAIEQSIVNSKNTAPDEFNTLPEHRPIPEFKLKIFDPKINRVTVKEKIDFALELERSAYRFDKKIKKTQNISYSNSEYKVEIANSAGLNAEYKGNHCLASAAVIAELDGQAEDGFGFDANLNWDKLDAKKIGEEAAQKAVELLNAEPLSAQKIPLIFDPLISGQILGIISGMVSAEAVQKGRSLFRGKLGQPVASTIATIVDHGRLEGGLGSAPFDGEGEATQKTIVIENGILKSFLYNAYAAAKDKVRSTGNASRSYSSPPSIGPTNFFFKPGKKSKAEILKIPSRALYVVRLMGLHTINPISGDFSVGASGLLVKNGQFDHPVRGVTIAGNLFELLNKIEAVGSDLRWFGSIASPTLLVSDISVSG